MPQSSNLPSLLSAGGGIPRLAEDTVEDPSTPEEVEVIEVTDDKGDPVWADTPTYADQWISHPHTCRPGRVQVAIFDLVDVAALDSYNALVAMAHPPEAPQIEILNDIVHPPTADGKMLALVRYRRIQYKRLIRERI